MAVDFSIFIDWTTFASAYSGSKPWVYRNLQTGKVLTPLLTSVPYRIQPTLSILTTSQPAAEYIWFLETPDRTSRAPENKTNLEVVVMSESSLPNLSDPGFSLGLPVSALPLALQRHQFFPALSVMAAVTVLSVSTSVPGTVVKPAAAVMVLVLSSCRLL